jgi:thiol-disulfide isomerase/thioredoxin
MKTIPTVNYTKSDFESLYPFCIKEPKDTVVIFTTKNCGVCEKVKETLESISVDYPIALVDITKRFSFYFKVQHDGSLSIGENFIENFPEILFYRDGKPRVRYVGEVDFKRIGKKFKKFKKISFADE